MASTAAQTQYRQEFIAAFEQTSSLLKNACTNESVVKGNQAVFLVAGSNSATAVTRGVNGLIPARNDDLNQYTATLAEWHDLVQRTGFNIFESQGDARRIMQMTTMGVLNRKIDSDILTEMSNTTSNTGSTTTMSLTLVMKALSKLGNNAVPVEEEDNMFFVASPAALAYLMQVKEFANADYVDVKPFNGPARRYRRWAGFNWIIHPNISGKGTSSELLYAFHRSAIGHAVDRAGLQTAIGYQEEQDYSYARATTYMGTKILQNSGLVKVTHDGSAYP